MTGPSAPGTALGLVFGAPALDHLFVGGQSTPSLRHDGSWRDTVRYAMVDDDWPAAEAALAARLGWLDEG